MAQRGEPEYHLGAVEGDRMEGRICVLRRTVQEEQAREVGEPTVERNWESLTILRPVDTHIHHLEVPVREEIRTIVPKVHVREIEKEVYKDEPQYVDIPHEIVHKRIVDNYVEKEVFVGQEIKYVPKVEVQERTIEVARPEVQWVNEYVNIPQIKEVVRYVESEDNLERVIRYVPKGGDFPEVKMVEADAPVLTQQDAAYSAKGGPSSPDEAESVFMEKEAAMPYSVMKEVEPSVEPPSEMLSSGRSSPRTEIYEQIVVPKVVRSVEIKKDIPVHIDVPVPYLVPDPLVVNVDTPSIEFRDAFVPVPVCRHVIPRVVFTDETYQVECTIEKPILVVEDIIKPVLVDVAIKLKEREVNIRPVDVTDLSQADAHAMWMRTNADLLEHYMDRHDGNPPIGYISNADRPDSMKAPADKKDGLGPVPLDPGHPLMLTYAQTQWMQTPSHQTHNFYAPEVFRLHAQLTDALCQPQPHPVNVTEEQAAAFSPDISDQLPNPWIGPFKAGEERPAARDEYYISQGFYEKAEEA